jgi:hypothetical protein
LWFELWLVLQDQVLQREVLQGKVLQVFVRIELCRSRHDLRFLVWLELRRPGADLLPTGPDLLPTRTEVLQSEVLQGSLLPFALLPVIVPSARTLRAEFSARL